MKSEKFYMGNGVLTVTAVTAIVCFAVAVVLRIVYQEHFLFDTFLCVCLFITYLAVVRHEKNIMKSMMGAVLVLYTVLVSSACEKLFTDGGTAAFASGADPASAVYAVIVILTAAFSVIMFILHLVICTGVNRAFSALRFMIVLTVVTAGLTIVSVCLTVAGGMFDAAETFEDLAGLFMLFVIIIIELKLCAYKLLRRSAAEESRWNAMEKRKLKKKVFGE